MSAVDPSAPGLPIVPSGGGSLPEASTAGELLVSDGAGTDYTPTPRSDVVTDALVEMIGGEPEGSAIISDGAGDIRTVDATVVAPVLAATTSAELRAAVGSPLTYYAESFTAENGSDTASISGTGSTSTFTLTITASSRTYGSGGSTAPRLVLPLPTNAQEVTVEIGLTAASGVSTGGFKNMVVALRNAADGGAPTILWGVGFPDGGGAFYNNLVAGGNAGVPSTTTTHSLAADRWFRVTLKPREAFLSIQTGAGSGGARPTTWFGPGTACPLQTNANSVSYPDTTSSAALAIALVSHGSAITTSLTGTVTVRVVPQ